jgi:hypothetical protein
MRNCSAARRLCKNFINLQGSQRAAPANFPVHWLAVTFQIYRNSMGCLVLSQREWAVLVRSLPARDDSSGRGEVFTFSWKMGRSGRTAAPAPASCASGHMR